MTDKERKHIHPDFWIDNPFPVSELLSNRIGLSLNEFEKIFGDKFNRAYDIPQIDIAHVVEWICINQTEQQKRQFSFIVDLFRRTIADEILKESDRQNRAKLEWERDTLIEKLKVNGDYLMLQGVYAALNLGHNKNRMP